MKTTFQAFVSSTYEDLKEHRARVIQTLRKSGFFVDPMEDWTAATDAPRQFSQDRVLGCDLFVLLVGLRRGHIPDNQSLSITQLEYMAAAREGIDTLVFMLDEQAPWPRQFDELDKDPGIREWRQTLKKSKGVAFFDHNLNSVDIAPALTRWSMEKAREMATAVQDLEHLLRERDTIKRSRSFRNIKTLQSSIEQLQSLEAGQALRPS